MTHPAFHGEPFSASATAMVLSINAREVFESSAKVGVSDHFASRHGLTELSGVGR